LQSFPARDIFLASVFPRTALPPGDIADAGEWVMVGNLRTEFTPQIAFRDGNPGGDMFHLVGFRISSYFQSLLLLLAGFLYLPCQVNAQQSAGAGAPHTTSSTPDSPQPKQQTSEESSTGATSHFIGYVTNRSIFFPDIASSPGSLSSGGKFKLFIDQSISPGYILAAGASAAFNQARNSPEATGQGWEAYGTRVGFAMARASSSSFFGTFLFASVFRQDPRFFPQHNPSFFGALKYSAERIVITRNDHGNDVFNSSGLLGPLAAEALSNVYLPVSEQTGARAMQRYASDLGWRFAGNMFKEYWPTLFRSMGLQRLRVVPNPGNDSNP
jgi:hypothetical protein